MVLGFKIMILSATGIKLSIGENKILNGIDIDAARNQLVGIIGPNGSGKSTLLKCIYRVLKPQCGAVFIDNKPLLDYTLRQSAKKIAVVAQHNYYNFDFTVEDVVLMGRSPHKKAMERDNADDYRIVMDALKKVGMDSFATRSFSSLSGGEQQRVILARALAQLTPCLILDEPTNHLDVKHQLQLMTLIKDLDIMAVAAVHDLNIAAMYCDNLYVLKEGKVVANGPPKRILSRELILDVYEVDARIVEDDSGCIHILYNR